MDEGSRIQDPGWIQDADAYVTAIHMYIYIYIYTVDILAQTRMGASLRTKLCWIML
jgi:hypothetical protein